MPDGRPTYRRPVDNEKLFALKMYLKDELIENAKEIDAAAPEGQQPGKEALLMMVQNEFRKATMTLWNESVKPWAEDTYGKNRP